MITEKQITRYDGIFSSEGAQQLETLMQRMQTGIPGSFDDFERCHKEGLNYLHALKQMEYHWFLKKEASDNPEDKAENEEKLNRIETIQVDLKDTWESLKLNYTEYLLQRDHASLKNILFNEATETEPTIRDRYIRLAKLFHSDKNAAFSETIKAKFDQLFSLITNIKEEAIEDINRRISKRDNPVAASYQFYRTQGHSYLERAIDMQNARVAQESHDPKEKQARWSRLKYYAKADLMTLRPKELLDKQQYYAKKAYQGYRASAQSLSHIGNPGNGFIHAQLRQDMMKSLYMQDMLLEAELYGICALNLLKNHLTADVPVANIPTSDLSRVFQEVLAFLKKIRDVSHRALQQNQTTEQPTSPQQDSNPLDRIQAQVDRLPTQNGRDIQSMVIFQEIQIRNAIRSNLSRLLRKSLVSGHGAQIVLYKSPEENILAARAHAHAHMAAGGAVWAGSLTVGGVLAASAVIDIVDIVAGVAIGSVMGGPIGAGLALLTGLVTIGAGVWAAKDLAQKGTALLQEPAVRECLNKMMVDALTAYSNREYRLFFEILSTDYHVSDSSAPNKADLKPGIKTPWVLINYQADSEVLDIDPATFIDKLLTHGFRPDGIAYLLSIIGEILLTAGAAELGLSDSMTQSDLDASAKTIFKSVEKNPMLKAATKALDEAVRNAQQEKSETLHKEQNQTKLNVLLIPVLSPLIEWMRLSYHRKVATEYYDIPKQYLIDSEKSPFQARLNEIRQICMMKQIISEIIHAEAQNLHVAKLTFKKLQDLVKQNFQFYSVPAERIAALTDLLFAIDPDFCEVALEPENTQPLAPTAGLISFPEPELAELYRNVKLTTSIPEKNRLHLLLALKHRDLAESLEADGHHMNSLTQWEFSKTNYEAISNSVQNQDVALGRLRCLIHLHHYKSANEQLLNHFSMWQHVDEYWHLRALTARHLKDYPGARYANTQALAINPTSSEALLERRILHKLPGNLEQQGRARTTIYKEYVQDSHSTRIHENRPYRILSLDDGGIRSIIPTVWISELERQTGQRVTDLFDLVAGTSTGGITAGGLVVPGLNGKPKYRAFDILDIYLTQSQRMFGSRSSKTKYTADGRLSVVKDYFGTSTMLSQTLLPVVIPAVINLHPSQNHVFLTRHHGTAPKWSDIALYHAIMATSAMPSYFPEYKIPGADAYPFISCGERDNNPARHALNAASSYGHRDNTRILLWSLGTGDYVRQAQNRNADRTVSDSHHDTDSQMHASLGQNYNRWQVYTSEPIALDDIRPETMDTLVDLALDYMEELEVRESPRRMSVLIEHLTDNKNRNAYQNRSTFFPQQLSSPSVKPPVIVDGVSRYKGTLPNGQSHQFSRHDVEGDGNCGFRVLDATRAQVAFALRSAKKLETRHQLASEIRQALMTEESGFSTPEWAELNATLTSRQVSCDELIRDILTAYPNFTGVENQQERNDALLLFLRSEHTTFGKIFSNKLQISLDKLSLIEASISAHCQSEATFDAYINGLEHGRIWLGYQSALIYARTANLNLYIWREGTANTADLDSIQQLFLMHCHIAETPTHTVHMIHTHNFTHFDELKEQIMLQTSNQRSVGV